MSRLNYTIRQIFIKCIMVKINIKAPSVGNKSIVVEDVELSSTVRELKERIQPELNVAPESQRLIFLGQVLKDEQTLESCGVQDGANLHMVKSGGASRQGQASSGARQTGGAAASGGGAAGTGAGAEMMGDIGEGRGQSMRDILLALSDPQMREQILAMNPALRPWVDDPQFQEQVQHLLANPGAEQALAQAMGEGGFGDDTPAEPIVNREQLSGALSNVIRRLGLEDRAAQGVDGINMANIPPGAASGMMGAPAGAEAVAEAGDTPSAAREAPAEQVNYEERFASELDMMSSMGFTDRALNIRALIATSGDVNAAVELVLSGAFN
eukprot:Clim_evm12s34 gene=Clim_evmTU12s34